MDHDVLRLVPGRSRRPPRDPLHATRISDREGAREANADPLDGRRPRRRRAHGDRLGGRARERPCSRPPGLVDLHLPGDRSRSARGRTRSLGGLSRHSRRDPRTEPRESRVGGPRGTRGRARALEPLRVAPAVSPELSASAGRGRGASGDASRPRADPAPGPRPSKWLRARRACAASIGRGRLRWADRRATPCRLVDVVRLAGRRWSARARRDAPTTRARDRAAARGDAPA
jgi:hypothetical protein